MLRPVLPCFHFRFGPYALSSAAACRLGDQLVLAGCAFVGVSPKSAELQAVGSAGSDLRCGGAGARHESSLRVTSRSAEQRVCRPPVSGAGQSGPAVRAGTMRWCVVSVALCALLPAAARACDCCFRNATAAECGVDARLEPRRDCACCAVCAVQKGGRCDDQLRPCQGGLECSSQGVCTGESARTSAGFQPGSRRGAARRRWRLDGR